MEEFRYAQALKKRRYGLRLSLCNELSYFRFQPSPPITNFTPLRIVNGNDGNP